ncbi:MAG: hypothetical protein ACM67R_00015 [Clostridiales bacterium]|nr:unknown [Clostridium sp. CAG:567]
MEELNNNEVRTEVPAEINTWTKIKNFLFQEVTFELTPKQEKVFKEVHDFWHQELNHDFWFQEIEIIDNITL